MYGAILVEPEEGLPPVDHEFSIIQSEYYAVADKDSDGTFRFYFLLTNSVVQIRRSLF